MSEYFGGAVPRWAGYTVGFDIVRRFASSNRHLTLSELARIAPRVIWQALTSPAQTSPDAERCALYV